MGTDIERAASLLQDLYGSGTIAEESTNALLALDSAALEIGRGLGPASGSSDLLLASVVVDDSTSIRSDIWAIRAGHETMLDALSAESRSGADVYVHASALNRGVLSPYEEVSTAMRLTTENFSEAHLAAATPLYRQSLLALGTTIAKAHEEEARGNAVRTFSLIITDGLDNDSRSTRARDVRALVQDMLEFSTSHIVAGMGVGGGEDFRGVFLEMGIPDAWIFTPENSGDELRAAFRRIARSLQLAASSESGFHQLSSGPLEE